MKTKCDVNKNDNSLVYLIKFLAKVMSVPFRLQGRSPAGFGKNLHAFG